MKNRLAELALGLSLSLSLIPPTDARAVSTDDYIISKGSEPMSYLIKGRNAYGARDGETAVEKLCGGFRGPPQYFGETFSVVFPRNINCGKRLVKALGGNI